jgi:hypothetical protein
LKVSKYVKSNGNITGPIKIPGIPNKLAPPITPTIITI